jgi:hypothetical protein
VTTPESWRDYQARLEQESITRRQEMHSLRWEREEQIDRLKRQLAIAGLVILLALIAGVLGYIIGSGGTL